MSYRQQEHYIYVSEHDYDLRPGEQTCLRDPVLQVRPGDADSSVILWYKYNGAEESLATLLPGQWLQLVFRASVTHRTHYLQHVYNIFFGKPSELPVTVYETVSPLAILDKGYYYGRNAW